MECFKCRIDDDHTLLYDSISNKGIVQVCRRCLAEEPDLLLVKRPNDSKFREADKNLTVHERLSLSAGINPYKEREKDIIQIRELSQQEKDIKAIAERNFQNEISSKQMPSTIMVDHFDWIIMRARRMKKLTQEQLANIMEVPEIVIKMAEKGLIKDGDFSFVRKLENKLGINILKRDDFFPIHSSVVQTSIGNEKKEILQLKDDYLEEKFHGEDGIDINKLKESNLSISDLKEIKQMKEQSVLKNIKNKMSWEDEVVSTKKIISDEFENL